MLDLVTTTQFRKDLKRIRKRGYDLSTWMMSCKRFLAKNLFLKQTVTMH